MASENEAPQVSSLFERLLRNRDLYLFLPFILSFPNNNNCDVSTQNTGDPSRETAPQRERMILVNPFTQATVVFDAGASNLEALLRGWPANKDGGHPPASKASMEAMPSVEIGEDEDGECVVCLGEWNPNDVAKEMPCKHRFHVECIEKWLKIHGSCPVCRYKMPVEDEEMGKKRTEEREIWVRFSFNNGGGNEVSSSPDEDGIQD